jgi:hypothetical protein
MSYVREKVSFEILHILNSITAVNEDITAVIEFRMCKISKLTFSLTYDIY